MRIIYSVTKMRDGKWACWKYGTSRASRVFSNRAEAVVHALIAAIKYGYVVFIQQQGSTDSDVYNNTADEHANYRRIIFTLNDMLREQADITDIIEPLVGLS